jgi:hypothetical protein
MAGKTIDWEVGNIVEMWPSGFSFVDEVEAVFERLHLPSVRDLPEFGVHELRGFVAGEAEVDEPLAVEGLRHLLQDLDAA